MNEDQNTLDKRVDALLKDVLEISNHIWTHEFDRAAIAARVLARDCEILNQLANRLADAS